MSGFKESAGTMTLYFKMNRHLQMMLQHGLFHLHIIVIVILEEKVVEVVVKTNEKVVAEAEVVVKSNEKVVAEADVFNEKVVAEVVVRMNEMLVAEAEVVNEKVVAEAVLLIKTKKKEVAKVVEIVDYWDKGKGTGISSISNILNH